MERIVRKSKSFAEDDRATKAYYAQLSPDQRLDILFELIARVRGDKSEAEQRFARVYRIAQLSRR